MKFVLPSTVTLAAIFMIAACLLLVHDVIFTPPSPMPDLTAIKTDLPVLVSAVPTPIPSPDSETYTTIADRPVFSAIRRPQPNLVNSELPSAGPAPIDFSLIGVVNSPEQKFGVAIEAGHSVAILLYQGSIIDGWTVTKINDASIQIYSGNTFKVVKIMQ